MILKTFTSILLMNFLFALSCILTLVSLFSLFLTLRTTSKLTQRSFFLITSAMACFLLNLMLAIRSIDPFYIRKVFLPNQSLFLDSIWSIFFISWSSSVLQASYATVRSVRIHKHFLYSHTKLIFPHLIAVLLTVFLLVIVFLKEEHARICKSILWVSVAILNCLITFLIAFVFLQLVQIVRSNVFTKTKWAVTIQKWRNGLFMLCSIVLLYTFLTLCKLTVLLEFVVISVEEMPVGYTKISKLGLLSFLVRNLGGFAGLYFNSIRNASKENDKLGGSMSLVNSSSLKRNIIS